MPKTLWLSQKTSINLPLQTGSFEHVSELLWLYICKLKDVLCGSSRLCIYNSNRLSAQSGGVGVHGRGLHR